MSERNVLRERLTEPLSDILEALELAGYAVVKRERWERVRQVAASADLGDFVAGRWLPDGLRHSDLDGDV